MWATWLGFSMSLQPLLKTALILSLITIFYNLLEGIVSVIFAANDDTLALLGFGIDSFVEVISGIGILHMVMRMFRTQAESLDPFERHALMITGSAFYLLSIGLLVGSIIYIITAAKPETTIAGVIISAISILTMYFLMQAKLQVGNQLNSQAIIADAHCTRTCLQLSFILLISSFLYEVFGIAWFDVIGSWGIAWFAFKEGQEAFEKSKTAQITCSSCGCHK
ncbi:MAG: hypothetical protein R3E08_08650 [Thiotrichaceae bacterium]